MGTRSKHPKPKRAQTVVRLPPGVLAELDAWAQEEGWSRNKLVSWLLELSLGGRAAVKGNENRLGELFAEELESSMDGLADAVARRIVDRIDTKRRVERLLNGGKGR